MRNELNWLRIVSNVYFWGVDLENKESLVTLQNT